MQLWYPRARKLVILGQEGGQALDGRPKIVLHTTEGDNIRGAEGAYRASGGSAPTFTISPWACHQHMPITASAYSLEHPPGTPQTNRAGHVVQIEQIGFARDTGDWPDAYYKRIRDLVHWVAGQLDVPLSRHDLSFQHPRRIAPQDWANWSGVCGHVHVPNNHHTDPGTHYHIGKVL